MEQVGKDRSEEADKMKQVLQALKPWLDYDLWKEEEKQKKAAKTVSSTYVDELKARGATDKDLDAHRKWASSFQETPSPTAGIGADDDSDDPVRSIPVN